MTQTRLEDLQYDEEHPIGEQKIEAWIKLEIGDTLYGAFIDTYEDDKYKNQKYIFQNVTHIHAKENTKQHFEKIGMNGTGNLPFLLTNDRLGEAYKIIRIEDLPRPDKPNDAHQFRVFPVKKTSKEKN